MVLLRHHYVALQHLLCYKAAPNWKNTINYETN
jgi:hypothetical protein